MFGDTSIVWVRNYIESNLLQISCKCRSCKHFHSKISFAQIFEHQKPNSFQRGRKLFKLFSSLVGENMDVFMKEKSKHDNQWNIFCHMKIRTYLLVLIIQSTRSGMLKGFDGIGFLRLNFIIFITEAHSVGVNHSFCHPALTSLLVIVPYNFRCCYSVVCLHYQLLWWESSVFFRIRNSYEFTASHNHISPSS